MQHARGHQIPRGALAEATFDALAADLTIPHARPLVDLERDEYADVEIDRDATSRFEPVTQPYERTEPAPRQRKRRTSLPHVAAALVTLAIGFGVGAGIALVLT